MTSEISEFTITDYFNTKYPPPKPPLVYSDIVGSYRPCPVALAWYEPVFSATITAPAADTWKVTFVVEKILGTAWDFSESFDLILRAGESFRYIFDNKQPGPGDYVKVVFGKDGRIKMYLKDDAGGKSSEVILP